jgi:glutathione S-transferase
MGASCLARRGPQWGVLPPLRLAVLPGGVHPGAVITLHTLPGTDQLESMSPFCMKVEVYLKLQKLPYKVAAGDPRKAPKKKLPCIESDGSRIADSSMILAHLESKADSPLDHGLSPKDRARAHILKRLFEESLYFVLLWSRWADDEGWEGVRPHIEAAIPAAVRWFVPGIIRKKTVAQTIAQGTGRHTRDEIFALGKADLEAVAALLGDGPYLIDDKLRTIDVVAYAFLANILRWPRPSPLTEAARALPVLDAYVRRIASQLTSDAQAA